MVGLDAEYVAGKVTSVSVRYRPGSMSIPTNHAPSRTVFAAFASLSLPLRTCFAAASVVGPVRKSR